MLFPLILNCSFLNLPCNYCVFCTQSKEKAHGLCFKLPEWLKVSSLTMHQLTLYSMIHLLILAPVMHVCKKFFCQQVSLPTLKSIHLHTKLIYKCSKSENESIKNQHKCYLIISGAVTRRKGRRHYFFQNEKLCKFTSQ